MVSPIEEISTSTALTPNSLPKLIKCTECGAVGHNRHDCSRKMDFCAKCLSRTHITRLCPSYRHQCQVCRGLEGIGEHSYGHTKYR